MSSPQGFTYKDAGVDIDAGDALVGDIKRIVKSTHRKEVLGGVGGFGALVELPKKYKQPVLVSGTDGVGTKLVTGAEPLFFLDYFATAKLDPRQAGLVIRGIAKGCKLSGCALVGGETAEMPGLYAQGDFDLAGFCVAVVEKKKRIDGSRIKAGDVVIALPSTGPHANGFSLIRKILAHSGETLDMPLGRTTLGKALLAPTAIYVKPILDLLAEGAPLRGMAHITGGGVTDNLPRCFPEGVSAVIDTESWKLPPVFQWLQQAGNVSDDEMRRVFNCGVGFMMVVPRLKADDTLAKLVKLKLKPWIAGQIIKGDGDVQYA